MARPVGSRGGGRDRVVRAALDLFVEHGVSGASLQMIAERLGVTKAAVYYQFHSKEEIVFAVLEPAARQMGDLVATAEAQPTRKAQIDATLTGLIDLVLAHRAITAVLQRDPAVRTLIRTREPFAGHIERLGELLAGPDPSPGERVAVSVLGAGLMLSGIDPDLDDLDDATLRRELLASCRALLGTRPAG